MAGYKIQLEDEAGNQLYPVTALSLVIDSEGVTAEQKLTKIESNLTKLTKAVTVLTGTSEIDGSVSNKIHKAIKIGSLD